MKGNREGNLKILFRQLTDSRNNSAGRHRDIPLADIQPLLCACETYKANHAVVILHGLSASHNDDIGNPFPGNPLDLIDLLEHLRRGKRTHQTVQGGCAETASHPASDLGRNADGISVMIFHPDALDHIPVI